MKKVIAFPDLTISEIGHPFDCMACPRETGSRPLASMGSGDIFEELGLQNLSSDPNIIPAQEATE